MGALWSIYAYIIIIIIYIYFVMFPLCLVSRTITIMITESEVPKCSKCWILKKIIFSFRSLPRWLVFFVLIVVHLIIFHIYLLSISPLSYIHTIICIYFFRCVYIICLVFFDCLSLCIYGSMFLCFSLPVLYLRAYGIPKESEWTGWYRCTISKPFILYYLIYPVFRGNDTVKIL